MKQLTEFGLNRTGVLSSDRPDQVERDDSLRPESGSEWSYVESLEEIRSVRKAYREVADLMGSISLPRSLENGPTTEPTKIMAQDPSILMDKLGERLAFERSSVRLYDALLMKCEGQVPEEVLAKLGEIRSVEASHFELLRDHIRKLGGDPTSLTPGGDSVGVASLGWIQLVTDPRATVEQAVMALHMAELADYDGWELLVKIAVEAGADEMAQSFQEAAEEEMDHLDFIRKWHEKLSLRDRHAHVQ